MFFFLWDGYFIVCSASEGHLDLWQPAQFLSSTYVRMSKLCSKRREGLVSMIEHRKYFKIIWLLLIVLCIYNGLRESKRKLLQWNATMVWPSEWHARSPERSIFEGTVPYNSCMFRMYVPPFIFSMSLVFDSAINNFSCFFCGDIGE